MQQARALRRSQGSVETRRYIPWNCPRLGIFCAAAHRISSGHASVVKFKLIQDDTWACILNLRHHERSLTNWLIKNMLLLTSALAIAFAGLTASAVRHVPSGQVHSLYRRGKPLRLLEPGTHWVLPGLDRIGHRIDLGGQVLRFEGGQANDHELRGTVYWQVLEPERADAMIEQAPQLIRRSALDALSGAGEGSADRRVLGARLKQALNGMLRERGVMVTRVELELG